MSAAHAEPYVKSKAQTPPAAPGGFTLATVTIRADQDLVSLSRRTRSAGEEFGLHGRAVQSLSVATYETARYLMPLTGVEAVVRLADGPALEVVFRIPAADAPARAALQERIAAATAPLRGMVHELRVADHPQGLAVSLLARFPTGARERLQALTAPESGVEGQTGPPASAEDLRQQHSQLEQAYHELQSELQETNRGVVALYAELESQADQIRQAEDRLRLLLDSVQDYAICMLSPQGEIASWNAGAERLFGFSADEIIGRHVACFYPAAERDMDLPAGHLREAAERGRIDAECLRVRRGGSAFDAHVVLTAVRRDRELRGFALVVRDITERKRLEDDLRRRAEDLGAANRAKEDFLATLSHELRTPLNAMLGWTRLLRMGKLDEAAMAKALETIERNAHIQEQLIADILDVSRIVTGKLRLDLRPIELGPIVEAALDAVRPALEAKGLAIDADTGVAATVLGDPDRLQQVVWNLLANAIKFTPPGGRIGVAVARQGVHAVVTVSDTGEGMPSDLLPFIFDRFRQGDGSVTRPHGGLGLGLSIVRHIVELHGGQVQAWSDGPGQGATFSVQLPVRPLQTAGPAHEADAGTQPLAGLKVLVVDDDADARDAVSTALAERGARTVAVGSAREALRMLPGFRPDVLVCGVDLPGEDGCTLIRRVRSLEAVDLSGLPAVALSASSRPEDLRRARRAGFQQTVHKPVEAAELAAVVRSLAAGSTRG